MDGRELHLALNHFPIIAVWMLSVVVVLRLARSASVGWTAWQGGFILSKSTRLNGAAPGSIVPSAAPVRARTTSPGTQE